MKRNPYFDNAKFILIFLVVLSHAISKLNGINPSTQALYCLLYSFHITCLFFISGYFAKPDKNKLLTFMQYIVPYLIFQPFCIMPNGITLYSLFVPEYLMWFILVLMYYQLSLSVFKHNLKLFTVLAIVASIFIGDLKAGTFLDLYRAVFYLPFFLVGYLTRINNFKFDFSIRQKYISVAIFLAMPLLYFHTPAMQAIILHADTIGARAGLYLVVAVVSCAFFCLAPKSELPFTQLGRNTLYVYLLHWIMIPLLLSGITSPVLLLIGSAVITIFLSTGLVKSTTWFIIEPHYIIKKKRPNAPP
jgi:fucose 4-O-acetylase-like acetyltransferase